MLHVFIWSSLVVWFVQASICLCKEKGSDLYPVPVVPELLHEHRLTEKDGISLYGVAGEVRGLTQTLRCRFLDFTGRVYVTLYSARETESPCGILHLVGGTCPAIHCWHLINLVWCPSEDGTRTLWLFF